MNISSQENYFDIAKNSNNVLNLGFVKDKYTLRMIFSSTDVMVVPSLIESFGMIALEALHCGTPSVVFDWGLHRSHW